MGGLVRPCNVIYALKRRGEFGAWGSAVNPRYMKRTSRFLPDCLGFYICCSSEADKRVQIKAADRRSASCRAERRRLL